MLLLKGIGFGSERAEISRAVFLILLLSCLAFAQQSSEPYQSQEISEIDSIPVLIKHLPEWESVKDQALISNRFEDLRPILGDQPVLSGITLIPGSEVVAANYDAGKLLIIEHPSPQAASEADRQIQGGLANTGVFYRRIGNYSAFVFEPSNESAANLLLDQIKYEKSIQWLGEDPFLLKRFERYVATTGRDVALSTVLFITVVALSAILLGVISGFLFFRKRERRRARSAAFSDAGGLTRLNLDDLSERLELNS